MLYLQRLLSTSAATPTLQRAILFNSLVNFKGLSGSWFETDRMIEFHNGDMKKIFKARQDSSLDLERLFEYCSLNSAYFTTLRYKLEQAFRVTRVKDTHATKSAQRDLLVMVEWLEKHSIIYIPGRRSNHIAPDLLNQGASRLANEALSKFNDRYQTIDDKDDSESEDAPTGFFTDGPAEEHYS
ncbi:MAG: hypothetical protein M1840_008799 [Geoglossum simile]|nr:MAG: hypothetical protein M1840_008799 [Geoglossum simile]